MQYWMRRKMLVILMPIHIPYLRSPQTCRLGDRLGSSSGAGFNEDDFPELTTSKFNSLRLRDDSPSGAGLVTNTGFLSSFFVQKKNTLPCLERGGDSLVSGSDHQPCLVSSFQNFRGTKAPPGVLRTSQDTFN